MPTMIQNMIETAKQKMSELGGAAGNIAKGVAGFGAGMAATPLATTVDMQANIAKAVPKVGLGAVGAVTGLEAPKTPDYNMSLADKTTELMSNSVSNIGEGLGVIGSNFKQGANYLGGAVREGLKGAGFTEPTPTTASVSPTVSATTPTTNLGAVPSVPSTVAQTTTPKLVEPVKSELGYETKAPLGEGVQPVYGDIGATLPKTPNSQNGSFGSDKEYADWEARGKLGNFGARTDTNPNDALFLDLTKKLADIANSGPAIGRATNVAALKGAIDELAPQTSFGAYGVAGINAEATKRGQDIAAETTQRGQDITAEHNKVAAGLKADENTMNALYHSGLLKQGEEELGIKKMLTNSKTPEGFLKLAINASPKVKITDPVTGAEKESHDLRAGVKMLTDIGFETPKGFKMPGTDVNKPLITPEQAKAEMNRRKALQK